MGSVDQDFRYMALNDLTSELQKESFTMDEPSERKLVAQVIRNLDDKNSEVQNLVVRWCRRPCARACAGPGLTHPTRVAAQSAVPG